MSELDAPLFPQRDWVDDPARARAEKTVLGGTAAARQIIGPIRALAHWVGGGSFHRYGRPVYEQLLDELGTPEAAVQRMHEVKSMLKFEGELLDGSLRWRVSYRRSGDADAFGLSSGPSTCEDVAYSALTMIEQHEREVYEQTTVIGTA